MSDRLKALDIADSILVADYATGMVSTNERLIAKELLRLHKVNQELVEALKEIAEWTERYTTPGHPISTVARAALAKLEESHDR